MGFSAPLLLGIRKEEHLLLSVPLGNVSGVNGEPLPSHHPMEHLTRHLTEKIFRTDCRRRERVFRSTGRAHHPFLLWLCLRDERIRRQDDGPAELVPGAITETIPRLPLALGKLVAGPTGGAVHGFSFLLYFGMGINGSIACPTLPRHILHGRKTREFKPVRTPNTTHGSSFHFGSRRLLRSSQSLFVISGSKLPVETDLSGSVLGLMVGLVRTTL